MSTKSYPRSRRVGQQLQRALSELIRRDVRDPRLGMVTLTDVRMSNDLSYAKVYYSVLGGEPEHAQEILDSAADMLRGPVGRALGIRHSPELRFVHDELIERGSHLSALITKAVREDQSRHGDDAAPDDAAGDDDSQALKRVREFSRTGRRFLREDLRSRRAERLMAPSTEPIAPPRRGDRRRFHRDVDGILLLDKPLGLSSNAALQRAREVFGALKAGHAGSLDPLATGLLPVCFGQATKVCGRLLNSGKTYLVDIQLGARTASGDGETDVVERAPVPHLTEADVDAALAHFAGAQQQIPPMHSALKFEGQRLYELARRGESVERAPRDIVIHAIRRVRLEPEELEFEVTCSKGTYIRTLASDIALRLGTVGYLKGLRRLSVEPFGSQPMHTLEDLAQRDPGELDGLLLPADVAFGDLPTVTLGPEAERSLLLGQAVRVENQTSGELRAYGAHGRFLGLVQGLGDGRVQPVRLFVNLGVAAPDR